MIPYPLKRIVVALDRSTINPTMIRVKDTLGWVWNAVVIIMTICVGTHVTTAFPQHLNRQLLGEWSLWHSNVPSASGSNQMIVALYPDSVIEVSEKRCVGPCIFQKIKTGEYTVKEDYEYEKERDLDPVYRTSVCIEFHRRRQHLLSLFGIGLDNMPIVFSEPLQYKQEMSLFVVEQGDLFLTFPSSQEDVQNDMYCYHLVRNVRPKEPSVNVPLSTLVATHLVSMLLNELLHIMKHALVYRSYHG